MRDNELKHYGKGHLDGGHSGRYPWGSKVQNTAELIEPIAKHTKEYAQMVYDAAKKVPYLKTVERKHISDSDYYYNGVKDFFVKNLKKVFKNNIVGMSVNSVLNTNKSYSYIADEYGRRKENSIDFINDKTIIKDLANNKKIMKLAPSYYATKISDTIGEKYWDMRKKYWTSKSNLVFDKRLLSKIDYENLDDNEKEFYLKLLNKKIKRQ